MKKNFAIGLLTVLAIIISTFVWDLIKLPYDFINPPYGEYSKYNFNPSNDTLRYVFFITIPLITFFVSYLFFYKNELFTLNQALTVKLTNQIKKNNNYLINFFLYLIIFFVIISFLSIDFNNYNGSVDPFHEGSYLAPSKNFQLKGGFWTNSYLEYGLFANFYPIIVWKIFSVETIGSIRFFEAIILLFIKIFLVLLCKKISENVNFNKENSLYYFVFLSIYAVTLVDFGSTTDIASRNLLTLFFLLVVFNSILKNSNFYKTNFFLGLFSATSMFWWIDVGVFINFMIFLLIIYFFYRKEFKKSIFILYGAIFGWIGALIFLPTNELLAFFYNTKVVILNGAFLDGLIYPTPFLSGDARATRALLLIIFTGILVIVLNFYKKINVEPSLKIFFSFLYVHVLVNFKLALMRSDAVHIKLASGLLKFLLFAILLYLLIIFFNKINNHKLTNFFKKFYLFITSSSLLIFFLFFATDIANFKRITHSFGDIKKLVTQDDTVYLNKEYIEMIDYYKKISEGDNCAQIFTNETAITYLLNKPTCSKFYSMWMAGTEHNQKIFTNELKVAKPKIILLESEIDWYYDSQVRLKRVYNFINSNYLFHSKFKHWTFVELKEQN